MSQSTGFKCTSCKKHHRFAPYVFAHWDIELIHTCSDCGAKHEVLCGVATQIAPGKPKQPTTNSKTAA